MPHIERRGMKSAEFMARTITLPNSQLLEKACLECRGADEADRIELDAHLQENSEPHPFELTLVALGNR
jgi:hypothetical protein